MITLLLLKVAIFGITFNNLLCYWTLLVHTERETEIYDHRRVTTTNQLKNWVLTGTEAFDNAGGRLHFIHGDWLNAVISDKLQLTSQSAVPRTLNCRLYKRVKCVTTVATTCILYSHTPCNTPWNTPVLLYSWVVDWCVTAPSACRDTHIYVSFNALTLPCLTLPWLTLPLGWVVFMPLSFEDISVLAQCTSQINTR